jgi:hypothetical protein
MTPSPELLGMGLETAKLGDWVLRILAIVGAAAVGGLGAGLIVQLSAKFLAAQTVPRPMLQIVRVLGALTCGLLVGYFLFHSGGSGGGWGGGEGPGVGRGKDSNGKKDDHAEKDSSDKDKQEPADLAVGESQVEIEVLLDSTSSGRHYRVTGQSKAWKLDEIDKMLAQRLKQKPPLKKMVIVVNKNSPDAHTPIVQKLKKLAEEYKLTPDISEPRGDAP